MITNYINFKLFFLAFIIGISFIYFSGVDIKKVVIYPNPLNVDEIQYKDHADVCFNFKTLKVKCPQDKSLIKSVPIQ